MNDKYFVVMWPKVVMLSHGACRHGRVRKSYVCRKKLNIFILQVLMLFVICFPDTQKIVGDF